MEFQRNMARPTSVPRTDARRRQSRPIRDPRRPPSGRAARGESRLQQPAGKIRSAFSEFKRDRRAAGGFLFENIAGLAARSSSTNLSIRHGELLCRGRLVTRSNCLRRPPRRPRARPVNKIPSLRNAHRGNAVEHSSKFVTIRCLVCSGPAPRP